MRFFTYYWNRDQLLGGVERLEQEETVYPLSYTGGSGFRDRGISSGDLLYVINFHDGQLRVLGRMTIDRVADRAEAKAQLGAIYDAEEHVLARPGTATLEVFDSIIDASSPDLDAIQFIAADGSHGGPKRRHDGSADPQTFRNVREITHETAELFDYYLGFAPNSILADGEPIVRLVNFDVLVRDDAGDEVNVNVDVPCEADTLLDRWVDVDLSVANASVPADASKLTDLVWSRVQRWCDAVDASPTIDADEFAALVHEELLPPKQTDG